MLDILYFASLREQLGCASEQVEYIRGESLPELAARLHRLHENRLRAGLTSDLLAASTRSAVNQKLAAAGASLEDGDEVAFFPPVTGG